MSQSLSDVLVHVVFSTKNRQPLILPLIEDELYRYIATIAKNQGSSLLHIGGVQDHVHLLVSLGRNISVSKIVSEIKANSSRWIKTKGSDFQDFSWQSGYGAFSVARRNIEGVVKYITNQKEHHRKVSFKDEFLIFLKHSGIEINEQYLWD